MSFSVEGIDDLMKKIDSIEVERIAPIMLEESAPILKKAVIKKASMHKDTGDMLNSIKATGAMRNARGYYICVRPTGEGRNGTRNMEKMAYLEFGNSLNQRPTPVLSPAVKACEEEIIDKMQEVFDREAGLT